MGNIFATSIRVQIWKDAIYNELEKSYREFLDKGLDYTKGYLDGRSGGIVMTIANFFDARHAGAQKALRTLENMTECSQ